MRPLAIASLVVNVLIVVTGGVVRLTASGLGCPTWPRCTEESFTPHGAMGIHSAIEFGNRMVTFLIAAVAIATFVAAWRLRASRDHPDRPGPRPRRPRPGRRRRHHRAHRPEPVDGLVPPAGLAGDDRAVRHAPSPDPGGRRSRRPDGPPDGRAPRPRPLRRGLGGLLRRHGGDRQRPARRRRLGSPQRPRPAGAEPAAHRPGLPAARPDDRRRARPACAADAPPRARDAATALLVVRAGPGGGRVRAVLHRPARCPWSPCTCSGPPSPRRPSPGCCSGPGTGSPPDGRSRRVSA